MKKFLIVGGGLAGSSLAIRLLEKGQTVEVVDSGVNNCSAVAVGQINPMVFRRMNKSWRLDEYAPEARSFYEWLEKESRTDLIIDQTYQTVLRTSARKRFLVGTSTFGRIQRLPLRNHPRR